MKAQFESNYKRKLFGKFTVFVNKSGNIEVADDDIEMVLQHKYTGVYHKENIQSFVGLIQTVFTKDEQKSLLCSMFSDQSWRGILNV